MKQRKPDRFGVHPDNVGDALRYNQVVHEFEFGEHKYRCNALDPLQQIHMARRLAPIILGALKPEGGRQAILARLAKFANLAAAEGVGEGAPSLDDRIVADTMDLATSVFEAFAATDEAALDTIIKKCGVKIFRVNDSGGGMPIWHTGAEYPHYRDMDGFQLISIVVRYLFLEFQGSIAEYISSLGLKPGPVLTAAMAQGRPPGAPGGV